jgi:hypothetical protein
VQGSRPEQRDSRRGGQQEGNLNAPTGRCRASEADEHEHREDHRPGKPSEQPRARHVVHDLRLGAHQEVVGRAAEAALRLAFGQLSERVHAVFAATARRSTLMRE